MDAGEQVAGEPPAVGVSGATPDQPTAARAPTPGPPEAPGGRGRGRTSRRSGRSHRSGRSRRSAIRAGFQQFIAAVEQGDEQIVESEVLRLSRTWRPLAPLATCVGAFVLLFKGLRRLWTNWRLIAVEALPAMWAWATMLDLKAHVFYGREPQLWQGPAAITLVTGAVVLTVGAFYLNTVFAFALWGPEGAPIRPAFASANRHLWVVSGTGFVVGVALGISAFVVPRWGLEWFTFALGIAVGVQMLASVLVPSRLVGASTSTQPRRDRLVASVIAAVLGAMVCAPTYALGRFGIALLGSQGLVALGIMLLVVGFALQSGTAGAVKAIKASAKVAAVRPRSGGAPPPSAADDGNRTDCSVANGNRRKEPRHDAPLLGVVAVHAA